MLRICRTCLQTIPDINFISLNSGIQSLQVKSELTLCVPEMVLDSVSEPVMCSYCVGALHSAYDFKRQCLQTEERIQNYIQNVHLRSDAINLSSMYDIESSDTSFKLTASNLGTMFNKPETFADYLEHDSNIVQLDNSESIKEELPSSEEEETDLDDYKIAQDCLETIISLPESDSSLNYHELVKHTKDEDSRDRFSLVHNEHGQKIEKPFQCTQCDYRSAEKSKLKRHLFTHNALKPFSCTLCEFKTRRKDTLTIHMREHSGEKPYKCLYCEFRGISRYSLNMHCMQTHGEEKPHKCPKCKYRAVEKSTLRRHMAVHSNDKPFKCDQCNFSTAWKYTWAKHIQGHGGMTYKCDLCNYSTIYKHNLSLHVIRHSGDRPFKCNKCDYQAAEKSKLKRHVLTHGNIKPYTCSVCNFGTTRNDTLKKHFMSREHMSKRNRTDKLDFFVFELGK